MDPAARLSHEIPPASAWSLELRRGRSLRLTALKGGVNASTLLYRAGDPVDRMNIPDTLKAQMSACIRAPMTLMSDRGVALASVASSLDWHDALAGHSRDPDVETFGPSSYADSRNNWRRSARFGLTSELAKYGKAPSELHACVNFFSKVALSDDAYGTMSFVAGHARAGDWVSLRAEVDLLVILSTAPHPMDPSWAPGPVLAEVLATDPPGEDDPSWLFRNETRRSLAAARAVFC